MDNEVFQVHSGEMLYIPKGAEYTYEVVAPDPKCIQVEFDLYCNREGKKSSLRFFDRPTKLIASDEAKKLFGDLMGCCIGDTFLTLSVLYRMLSLFFGEADFTYAGNGGYEKIRPALNRINKNICHSVSVTELAELCGLSTSHFRRLFKSLMGKSPVRYKNQLIMKHACRMLDSGVMNVSEISDALGFADVYTFSQTFKKEIGVSPSQYTSRRNYIDRVD